MTDRPQRFPWFPFYVADWRMSNTVRAMTYEQRGVYAELLAIAWDDGREEPSLPDDGKQLAALTALGRRWAKLGAPILATCFELRDGRHYNDKLSHVWEVQRAKYELASIAGKASARQRARQQSGNGSPTDVQRGGQRTGNRSVNRSVNRSPTDVQPTSQRRGNLKSTIQKLDAYTDRNLIAVSGATTVGALVPSAVVALTRKGQ